jgi:hypothetical protein
MCAFDYDVEYMPFVVLSELPDLGLSMGKWPSSQ